MQVTKSNLTKFLELLNASDAVEITGSPCLTNWEIHDTTNDPENIVVHFTWTDDDGDFRESFTEGEIAQGHFALGGKYVFDDGDEITFFKQVPIETMNFDPGASFDSPRQAVDLINLQPNPIDALLAVVKANVEYSEFGFASEVISEFGLT
jgi:hypothetical protein